MSAPSPADSSGLPRGYALQPEWEVTPQQVFAAMSGRQGKPPLVIDCRRHDEWNFCRIEGSVLMPLSDLPVLREQVEDHLGDHPRPIIVYCHHGRRSLQAAAILRQMGFDGAMSMAGGIEAWSIAIDPRVPRY